MIKSNRQPPCEIYYVPAMAYFSILNTFTNMELQLGIVFWWN